uniref:Cytochrome b n=1 Tax=Tabachnickia sp. DVL-2014 TaxID=1569960 RepID=A0A0N7ALC0_9METZ|nr:apocytochrome b [Tabachnickia sp. DVL-2014]
MKNYNKPYRKKHFLINLLNPFIIDLPTPSNINYLWNFGSLLSLCLIIQLITGILLAMHYSPDIDTAFKTIAHITRDINKGFILRNLHANGASLFFLCIYIHIARSMYHGSWKNTITWNIGITLYILTILTAFIGYVLPWGQMSFWAATVITNLLSAIPFIGYKLVQWIWGGFSISGATLNRFYKLHYVLPFIILLLTIIHLLSLHNKGSNNPTGLQNTIDNITFHPYNSIKDIHGFTILAIILTLLTLHYPSLLTDPENFIPANSMITPIHIQPEWYFLYAYAILRSIPNKLGGTLALIASILILYSLPITQIYIYTSATFRPGLKSIFWLLITTFLLLTWIGSEPAEKPYTLASLIVSSWYFLLILILIPLNSIIEKQSLTKIN